MASPYIVIDDWLWIGFIIEVGNKMAMRLANKGFNVVAWNRTVSKAEALAAAAASATSQQGTVSCASTPSEAISSSSVIVLMLADLVSIRKAVMDSVETMASVRGKTVIQMGTIGGINNHIQACFRDNPGGMLDCFHSTKLSGITKYTPARIIYPLQVPTRARD